MAGVSVELFGYPDTLATDAAYGDIPCLVEAPRISAARFRIGDPVSSDQSCSMLLTGDHRVREMLLLGRNPAFTTRLSAPLHPQDDFLYLGDNRPTATGFWIGDEKLGITGRAPVTDSRSPYYSLWRYAVTRGVDGTPVSRFDLDEGVGPRVELITSNLALPNSARGKWGEVRIHRDAGEPCLNQDDPAHVHAEGCSRVVFTGQVARVIDAGDTIELEMQSGIQTLLDQAWPTIPALPVMSQSAVDAIDVGGLTVNKVFTHNTQLDSGRHWGNYAAGTYSTQVGGSAFRELVLSTGPVYWVDGDGAAGVAETLPDSVEDIVTLQYPHMPAQADNPEDWVAVAVLGTDGFTGLGSVTDAQASASSQEYIVLGLEYVGSRADANPAERPHENSGTSLTFRVEPLGTHAYRMPVNPINTLTDYAGGWFPTRDAAIADDAPYNIRTWRLTAGDEYRTPYLISTNNTARCFVWRSHADGLPSTPGTPAAWWLPQLWSPWVPEVSGRPSVYVDHGMSGIAHLVVDLPASVPVLAAESATWGPVAFPYSTPYGLIRRTGTETPDTAVFPPEFWYQKTIKDSFFNDLWVSSSICWAPGKGGKLRPLRLSAEPSPGLTLTGDDLRARDATLNFSFSRSLSRATVSGLPKNFRVPDDGNGNVWMPGQEPIIVRNTEEAGGRSVTLKDSPLLRNDGLLRGSVGFLPSSGVRAFLNKISTTWRNAVNRFSEPVPEITLRIDGDLDVYPGDYVRLALPNVIASNGEPLNHPSNGPLQLALCLERGDDLSGATAECTFLMIGWHDMQEEE